MAQSLIDRRTFNRTLLFSVLLPLFLMLLLSLVLIGQINRLLEGFRRIDHTDQVIAQARVVSDLLMEMETAHHNYLMTPEPALLDTYTRARPRLVKAIESLSQLVRDNQPQLDHLRKIETTANGWNDAVGQEFKVRGAGSSYTTAIAPARSKPLLDALRLQIAAFVQIEENRRAEQTVRTEQRARSSVGIALLGALCVGVLLALLFRQRVIGLGRSYERSVSLLRSSEQNLATTLRSIGDGVIATNREGAITFMNPVAERLTGWKQEDSATAKVDQVFRLQSEETGEPVDNPAVVLLHEQRAVETETHDLLAKPGGLCPVEHSATAIRNDRGEIVGAVLVFRDVSARKQLEGQFLQAQKMEGIGRLAGGIAHDFNNLLTAIIGFAEMAEGEIVSDAQSDLQSPTLGYLHYIRRAGERAADLTRQLLAFSRQQIISPKIIDPHAAVLEVDKMLRRLLGEDVELVTLTEQETGAIRVDPGQFEQILINLAVNARDAMPNGGKLTLEVGSVTLDQDYARVHKAVTPGEHVMIAVTDTGMGMDPQTLSRIFDPFFTTKERGKGTGLGLSTVYGIVKQSGGNIWVYSEPGHGTTFKVYFPRVFEPLDSARSQESDLDIPRGRETVLVVEDETLVREVTVQALQDLGYTVLAASGPEEAQVIAGEFQEEIHLLLTDVVMPLMSGQQLAERLAERRPQMLVLYASGYTDNSIVHHGVLDAGVAFLQKPFTKRALAQKVREVLEGKPALC